MMMKMIVCSNDVECSCRKVVGATNYCVILLAMNHANTIFNNTVTYLNIHDNIDIPVLVILLIAFEFLIQISKHGFQ